MLSSCVPFPFTTAASSSSSSSSPSAVLSTPALDFRQLVLKRSVVVEASGSCSLELGNTKVVCSIQGPRASLGRLSSYSTSNNFSDSHARVECEVKYSPWYSAANLTDNASLQKKERQLSQQILNAVDASILTEKYPKTLISINVCILQACGGELSACIMAASLALLDAGIEIKDIVTSCTVMKGTLIGSNPANPPEDFLDPSDVDMEQVKREGRCMITLSSMPSLGMLTSISMAGRYPIEVIPDMMNLGMDGCQKLRDTIRNAFL